MCKNNVFVISSVVFVCAYMVSSQSIGLSRCFQFTWLGPRWNNESVFLNATCQDATRLASGVPCVQPLVVSYDGTWPDVHYIWKHHSQNASCILANNDVCATYTYYFDGQVENSTHMCTRAVNDDGQAITSGCFVQTNGSFVTRACFCRSVPGGLPSIIIACSLKKRVKRKRWVKSWLLKNVYTHLNLLDEVHSTEEEEDYANYYRTGAQMNTVKVVVKNVPDYGASRERNDLGFLTFDLKTDLSHLFNWNVKQLFLYLTAEYVTPNNELNQVVLWDKIILRGENALLDFKNMNTKYYFWDDGNGLKGHNNVTLTLSWNIIPNAGLLPNIQALGQHSFKFPVEYTQTRV
ncbi:hypothetical protein K1T71_005204 [Dendrolimus kikuchii]|uniref:Uncharacterized protein n=1 Tax=Dendrolimus kikuchii TaxID=765133 RepID=A0ACC1D6N9_9NEOP|nr:hypothetical protein K1T71_005204 [Dendrolimus kikuchii]